MEKTCKSCGGMDHERRSSARCANYLPPIRKRKLSETAAQTLQVYVVKRDLCSVLCPLISPQHRSRLIEEIRRDVHELSRIYVKLGIFFNLYMKTAPVLPDTPDVLNFVYAMKGKGPYADSYAKYFGDHCHYDGKLRSFIVQELAKLYEVTLRTNIITHAYSRLVRYFKVKRNDERLFRAYYEKVSPDGNDYTSREIARVCAVINKDTMDRKRWWKTVPEWIRIQQGMETRSFRLFPQPSHGLKHVTYTSRGWHEMLRRVAPDTVPGAWTQITDHLCQLWTPWLDVPAAKFGCCLQTDGVSVSLSMNRCAKPQKTEKKKKPQRIEYDRVIAVDPGSRVPLATVESKRFAFKRVTRKYVRSQTLEWKRDRVRNKLIAPIVAEIQKDRESFTFPVSSKNTDHVIEYTAFRIKWFEAMQVPYEMHSKLTRLGLDKYIRVAKCEEQIVRQVFDGGGVSDVLVLYGAGCKFMNTASFSGRKFRHDSLLKRLRSKRNVHVEIVNESYTSQACSACNQRTGEFQKIGMNHRLRWGVCPTCHSEFDRDANAAKNILINHTRSTICRPRCLPEKGIVTSRGVNKTRTQ